MTGTTAPVWLADVEVWDPGLGDTKTLHFANRPFTSRPTDDPANVYYDARILQPVDITRTMFSGGTTQGRSMESIGDLVLSNPDGELDDLLQYGFDGRSLVLYSSTVQAPVFPVDFDTYTLTMLVPELDDQTLTIKIRDRQSELSVPLQTTKYAGDNALPDGLEGVSADLKGKPKPVCYGSPFNVPAPCVNTSTLTYQVNDGPVEDIPAVYDKGEQLTQDVDYATSALMQAASPSAGTYITCLAEGYFRLGSSPVGLVTCDPVQGATSTDRTAAQVFVQVLARAAASNPNFAPKGITYIVTDDGINIVTDDGDYWVSLDNVNDGDIGALDAANSAEIGYWSGTDDALCIDVLELIAETVGAWWGTDTSGVYRIQQFTAPSGTPVLTITANDMPTPLQQIMSNDPGDGLPVYRCTVRWGQSYAVQTTDLASGVTDARRAEVAQQWRSAVSSDASVQLGSLLSPETIEDSLFIAEADAQDEADRRLGLRSVRRNLYQAVVQLTDETRAIEIGDVIQLNYPRFALSTVGGDDGALVRVLDVAPNARDETLTLKVWGREASRNLVTDDGLYLVCDDGTYIVTSPEY